LPNAVINPNNAFRVVSDYRTYLDADGLPLEGSLHQEKTSYLVTMASSSDSIAVGDACYFVAPADATTPLKVAKMPVSATGAQHIMFAGIADTAATYSATNLTQGVTLITAGLAFANITDGVTTVSAGSGYLGGATATPAFGLPVVGSRPSPPSPPRWTRTGSAGASARSTPRSAPTRSRCW
jgi:hypothetical protein